MLRTYGDKTPDMENIDSAFQFVLGHYDIDVVVAAFSHWLKTQTYAPTPADIVNIIEKKPIFDTSLYLTIKKNIAEPGEFVTDEEKDYVRKYEAHKLNEGLGE